MKRYILKGLVISLICAVIVIVLFVLMKRKLSNDHNEPSAVQNAPLQPMNVALYPYVPDIGRFETAVRKAWTEEHEDIPLNFVDWDCYVDDPSGEADVFVFDAVFLSDFVQSGCLLPIPENRVSNISDIVLFALEGCREDGTLRAVPQMLCTYLLYTRKSDTELSSVNDIVTLHDIIGDRNNQTEKPEANEGLLIDLSDDTAKAAIYLDALCDADGKYSTYTTVPDMKDISPDALEVLRLLRRMGGTEQVNYISGNALYERAEWFAEGSGRAYIGFAEAMSAMGNSADDMDFRLFSYTENDNIPLFFCDAAGIRSDIPDEKKELAYELLDIVTCERVMTEALSPDRESGIPQYILPARIGVYDALGTEYPVYGRLKEIAAAGDNKLFKIGPEAREYFTRSKAVLPQLMLNDK